MIYACTAIYTYIDRLKKKNVGLLLSLAIKQEFLCFHSVF